MAESLDLEKYFDVYDITDLDIQDANQGYSEDEFDDMESLRALKILFQRHHIIKKIFLCCLLTLDADGSRADHSRWNIALEEIQRISVVTANAEETLRGILSEEDRMSP
jgi:hypothetical protein